MGNVIQMFKTEPALDEVIDEDDLHTILTPELEESIAHVQDSFHTLWASTTPAEFVEELRRIKDEVKTWPSRV